MGLASVWSLRGGDSVASFHRCWGAAEGSTCAAAMPRLHCAAAYHDKPMHVDDDTAKGQACSVLTPNPESNFWAFPIQKGAVAKYGLCPAFRACGEEDGFTALVGLSKCASVTAP